MVCLGEELKVGSYVKLEHYFLNGVPLAVLKGIILHHFRRLQYGERDVAIVSS